MILLFSGLYVLLCILAFLVWHDFIAAPDEKSLTGRIVVKRKWLRVLARMSMLLFGPLWFLALILGAVYMAITHISVITFRRLTK